jgi:hypothetical protein
LLKKDNAGPGAAAPGGFGQSPRFCIYSYTFSVEGAAVAPALKTKERTLNFTNKPSREIIPSILMDRVINDFVED